MPAKAIRVHDFGGPEVLRWEEVEVPDPGPGELLVRHTAIGLNFIEVYQRAGLYSNPLPFVPGNEAAGRVEAVGPGVREFQVGDRVAYGTAPVGSYAEVRVVPADRVVKLPRDVGEKVAAAVMLKGMTAEYLLRRTFPVRPGQTILFHAAAGGVGLLAIQWAKALGATVVGTVSTDQKAALARKLGCDHVVVTSREDFVDRVREVTGGRGVPVVYDSVGKDTFAKSLQCLAPRGMLVLFGQSSGPVPPVDPAVLQKGSTYLTRPSLFAYNSRREDLLESAAALFEQIESGHVTVDVQHSYPLERAADAHRALEGRKITGSCLLLP